MFLEDMSLCFLTRGIWLDIWGFEALIAFRVYAVEVLHKERIERALTTQFDDRQD